MNKPLDQSDTCEVPVEISVTEQCEATLLHYERLADLAHEWNNQVPQAIRAWYAAINASPGSGGQAQINAAPSGPTEMELDYANEVLVGGYDGVKNILASAVLRWAEQTKGVKP